MNIYQAIMAAAAQIESHPQTFNFSYVEFPERDTNGKCNSPGCAIGWVGHFAGYPKEAGQTIMYATIGALGLRYNEEFYHRMDALIPNQYRDGKPGWRMDAQKCAKTLRLYAAKYHAPIEPAKPDTGFRDFMQKAMQPIAEKAPALT